MLLSLPGFLHSLPTAFIHHGSAGYPFRFLGASFLSFLISQSLLSTHWQYPAIYPKPASNTVTRSINTCPFSQNVFPSLSLDFSGFHSLDNCRHCSGLEITFHLPVSIESYCRNSTTLTSTLENHNRPLCTPSWGGPNRLQTRGPDLVIHLRVYIEPLLIS